MSVQGRRKAELLEEVRELEERLEHLSAATAEGVFVHEAGRFHVSPADSRPVHFRLCR
jgi:hypothetical protein